MSRGAEAVGFRTADVGTKNKTELGLVVISCAGRQVLSAVSSLKIRGGYYPGGMERSWLKGPRVTEGAQFNRSDAGELQWEGAGGEVAREVRKRSERCEAGETVTVALKPVTSSGSFNIALKKPWTHYFSIPNLPEVYPHVRPANV